MPNLHKILSRRLKFIGIAANHGGFEVKQYLLGILREAGYHVTDLGNNRPQPDDDNSDFIVPLARAVAAGTVDRGIGICGSGEDASIAANKVAGVRARRVDETIPAPQGGENDDLNLICLDGHLVGHAVAWERVQIFLAAHFSGVERHRRSLAKVAAVDGQPLKSTS